MTYMILDFSAPPASALEALALDGGDVDLEIGILSRCANQSSASPVSFRSKTRQSLLSRATQDSAINSRREPQRSPSWIQTTQAPQGKQLEPPGQTPVFAGLAPSKTRFS